MKSFLSMGLCGLASMVSLSMVAVADDADAGRKVAIEHCSRCHVIGDYNPRGGIDSTPSFQGLAKFDDYDVRFQTFYGRRPHPVFVRMEGVEDRTSPQLGAAAFDITDEQLDDILAFVETLRNQD